MVLNDETLQINPRYLYDDMGLRDNTGERNVHKEGQNIRGGIFRNFLH
jgi:hypothetical protein